MIQIMRCGQCGAECADHAASCGSCGSALPSAGEDASATLDLPPPEAAEREVLFGRYEVIAELGQGGMGRVLRVRDRTLDEEVALKLLAAHAAERGDSNERLRNELKLARKITHKNVCRVYDFNEEGDTPYITMEYVAGEELTEVLRREGKLPVDRTLELTRAICEGLAEAHRLGVTHRDLKPSNIMLDADGEPRIMDFGLARSQATAGLTAIGTMLGTPHYMPPEQVEGTETDSRSDIYSLGAILYEMCVGRPPFVADTALAVALKHKTEPVTDPSTLASEIPEALSRAICRCLEKRMNDRFQSVSELMDALGLGGSRISMAPVSVRLPGFLDPEAPEIESAEAERFVARERELERLDGFLQAALAGRFQTAFVTGDPGQGKSTLVKNFAQRAREAHAELVVALGRCNPQTGSADPYQPFREILALLTGDVESRWQAGAMTKDTALRLWELAPFAIEAICDEGQVLIDSLVPRRTMATRMGTLRMAGQPPLAADETLGVSIQENRIHDQVGRVLARLARQRPLLLMFEDLHWVDIPSVNLLAHLSQSLEGSPILILGTYRAGEVAAGRDGDRHPMRTVVNQLKARQGEVEIGLDDSGGRDFLDALLDSEPNRLDAGFRRKLFNLTGGHALFTVELLRDLQDRGLLIHDDEERWVEGSELAWDEMPVRTEGVIGERLSHLPEELVELLQLAALQGERFIAEVLARLMDSDDRSVVRRLSGELTKRFHLVEPLGVERIEGRRVSIYRFRHALYQKYLYQQLDEIERSFQHEDVAVALEEIYGGQVNDIAVDLARHYEAAGANHKAVTFRQIAGATAIRLSAYHEALSHLSAGIRLLESEKGSKERDHRELDLRSLLGVGHIATKGYAAPEVEENFARSRALCRQLGDAPRNFPVLYGLWAYHLLRGHRDETVDLAERLAKTAGDEKQKLIGETSLATTLLYSGELAPARKHFEAAIGLYTTELHAEIAADYTAETAILAHGYYPWCLWLLGEYDKARASYEATNALAERFGAPYAVTMALLFEWLTRYELREEEAALDSAERFLDLSTEQNYPFFQALATMAHGHARARSGAVDDGLEEMTRGLEHHKLTGALLPRGFWLRCPVEILLAAERYDDARPLIEEGLAMAKTNLDTFYEGDLLRLEAELMLARGGEREPALDRLRRAVEIAQRQGARSLELRARMSQCRALNGGGDEARAGLAKLVEELAANGECRELEEARALL